MMSEDDELPSFISTLVGVEGGGPDGGGGGGPLLREDAFWRALDILELVC